MKFIRLTTKIGTTVWINIDHIILIQAGAPGSFLELTSDRNGILIQESPVVIMDMMKGKELQSVA